MINLQAVVLGSALLLLSPLGFANPVSNATIVKWLINPESAQGSPQKIQFEKTQAIKLANGEQALLSSVQFAEAGRNFWGGYILTRPDLKKSLILEKFGGQANEFKVLSNAHPMTLLQLSAAGSGQGDIDQTDYIVGFKGWVAQVLYEADNFSHGFGRYTALMTRNSNVRNKPRAMILRIKSLRLSSRKQCVIIKALVLIKFQPKLIAAKPERLILNFPD